MDKDTRHEVGCWFSTPLPPFPLSPALDLSW
jgi:hypothetical protein